MKPKGRVEVVQDENEDTSVWNEVFQVNELVEPYRVASSIDFEENSIFCVFDDSLVDVDVDVDAEELNVNEDDDDIHIEYYDGADD